MGQTDPVGAKTPTFARSASAVTPSEEVQLHSVTLVTFPVNFLVSSATEMMNIPGKSYYGQNGGHSYEILVF